jgi:hypothetical protein
MENTTEKPTTRAVPIKIGLSLSEAADISGLCRRTLENYARLKLLRVRKHGRRSIVLVKDLEQFLSKDHPSPRIARSNDAP